LQDEKSAKKACYNI